MSSKFENPFAVDGRPVTGNSFIGRSSDLRMIENRVVRSLEPGNLAIIGVRKIGKTSLVHKALFERKEKLLERKRLPIRISLGLEDRPQGFFRRLVTESLAELRRLGWESEYIRYAATRALQETDDWNDGYQNIQKFFLEVRRADIYVIFILDEFDRACDLFKGNILSFQQLRELSDPPELRVTFVTLSSRPIRDIELQHQSISTFDGIFHKHYLGMFAEADMTKYFEYLSGAGIPLASAVKEKIDFYCGGHPYLLTMLGYQLVELFRHEEAYDIDTAVNNIGQSFGKFFESMTKRLHEDQRLNKLLQVALGPCVDLQRTDVDELVSYGLIKKTQQDDRFVYPAFSAYFESFLWMKEREIDLWPLLGETEKKLRKVIEVVLREKDGENWFSKLEEAHPKLGYQGRGTLFERCRDMRERDRRKLGSEVSQNPLDYVYLQELIDIICVEWAKFEPIFGKGRRMDPNYWKRRVEHVTTVRNPLAHFRDAVIKPPDRRTAEVYCREILDTIHPHLFHFYKTESDHSYAQTH